MENSMITLTELRNEGVTLPEWYDENVHENVCKLVEQGNLLTACKYLCDTSKQNGLAWGLENRFGLTWAKKDVVDVIKRHNKNELPMPVLVGKVAEIINDDIQNNNSMSDLIQLLEHVPYNVLKNYYEASKD